MPKLKLNSEIINHLKVALPDLELNLEDFSERERFVSILLELQAKLLEAEQYIYHTYEQLENELGAVVSNVEFAAETGFLQRFEKGAVYYKRESGANAVVGEIYNKYRALGEINGFLGFPTTNPSMSADGVGRYNHFEGGSIFHERFTHTIGKVKRPFEVHGAIRQKWIELGAEIGWMGYPVSDEYQGADGVGRVSQFQNGYVYYTNSTGAHYLRGVILEKWKALGGEKSYLGFPMSDELKTGEGNTYVEFERGSIHLFHQTSEVIAFPHSVLLQSGHLNTPEPITGWVELRLFSNGGFTYTGHLHNSGFIFYECSVASVLHFKDINNNAIGAFENCQIHGSTSVGSRNHDWSQAGFNDIIKNNWEAIKSSGMTTTLKVDTTPAAIVSAIMFTIPYLVGAFFVALVASGAKLKGRTWTDSWGNEHKEVEIEIEEHPHPPH